MAEGPVRDTRAMIAGMRPVLMPGTYVFCAAPPGMSEVPPEALASFREDEGLSLLLPIHAAAALELPTEPAMRRITLQVNSDLEGVGLTSAVAGALTDQGIPCNVIAALRHDHVFVPEALAGRALDTLEGLASKAG